MDSCVTPLWIGGGAQLVQTTDFFYPLVDDPYVQGRIAAANVLSDLYAMGVDHCDNMLMLLGIAKELSEEARDVVLPQLLRGFADAASEAGTRVEGGQTVINPWLTIGGVATAVCLPDQMVLPDGAQAGDVLVLTKPLGTQVAVNAWEWLKTAHPSWAKLQAAGVTEAQVTKAYFRAMDSMGRLNRSAARLMRECGAHGATDVTGFGVLGHAKNLAECQKADVSLVLHHLPLIAGVERMAEAVGSVFGLLQGTSAETSGGLLIALPRDQVQSFLTELERLQGTPGWVVGSVEAGGGRTARLADQPLLIPVPQEESPDKLW